MTIGRNLKTLNLMSAEIDVKDMALFLFRFAFFQVHPLKGISFESFFALYIYIHINIFIVYIYIIHLHGI